jgi:Zinc knuckle
MLGWTEKPHLTISTLLGITGRRWSLDLAARSSSAMMSQRRLNGWMEKAIQFDTNWRMGSLFFNQDIKANPLKQKADTNKSNGNTCWWRTSERKDPNAMDVDALTIEERRMLLRQGKCFYCKKTGHMAKDCPPEQGESSKQKKVDPARFAYTTIKALTKEQRESFTKMVMEDKDEGDF